MAIWRTWANRLAVIGVLLLAVVSATVSAEEVSFVASVDQTEVGLAETLTLTLSITASQADQIQEFKAPSTGTLSVLGTHQQTSTMVNITGKGQEVVNTQNVVITLQPTKEGDTTIGSASLSYQGKTYKTDPIKIKVVKGAGPKKPSQKQRRRLSPFNSPLFQSPFDDDDFFDSSLRGKRNNRQGFSEEDLFVEAVVTPDAVTEGQQATVSMTIYNRVGALQASARWPKLEGFFTVDRDVSEIRSGERYVNGKLYNTKLLAQKALFPMESGELIIDPIEVEVEVAASFFRSERRVLRTRPLKLKVSELPKEGRPANFHKANVGKFSLSAAVDANEVNLNQPVTFTVTLRGTGNIQQVRPPELPGDLSTTKSDLDRFKRFDPSVEVHALKKGREIKGTKTFEYVLVPLASGELTIPALSFSYFDPEDNQYHNLQTDAQLIKVAPSQAKESEKGAQGREVNIVAGAFKPIRYESTLSGYGPPFYRQPLFLAMFIGPMALYLMLLVGSAVSALIRSESPRSRARQAASRAQRRMKKAQVLLDSGQAADFFAEVKAALLDAVEAVTGVSAQGVLLGELQSRILAMGVPAAIGEALVREIENCDFGRFAPATSRGEEMQASFERVKRVLKDLQKRRAIREAGKP